MTALLEYFDLMQCKMKGEVLATKGLLVKIGVS